MKKTICLIFVLLSFMPMLSAVEISMNQNFSQGETLIAKATGIFLQDIRADNLVLYRDYHVRVPMQFEIYKLDSNNYYIYTQLSDKASGNYSLVINQIQYKQAGKIIQGDIWENFTITNSTADFYIDKGFVASRDDFSIELTNYLGTSLDIKKKITNSSSQENASSGGFFASLFGISSSNSASEVITLLPGETKSVDFKISDFNNSSFIQLTSNNTQYNLPVIKLGNGVSENKQGIYFDVSDINISMATNSSASRIIYLKNSEDFDIENISLTLSDSIKDYASISVNKIDEIKANSTAVIYLNFSSGNSEISVSGLVEAESSDGFSDSLAVSLDIIKGYIPPKNNASSVVSAYSKTCSEIGGTICTSSQKCNSTITDAKDGKCCMNNGCQDIPKSSTSKTVGWIIVILIVLFLAWFYFKKYKKPKKPVNVLEVAEHGGKKEKGK